MKWMQEWINHILKGYFYFLIKAILDAFWALMGHFSDLTSINFVLVFKTWQVDLLIEELQLQLKIQGGFFNWSALKMTKCQTLRKFWHLELFWRDLHVIWHLVIFRADQLKKPPCRWWWTRSTCQRGGRHIWTPWRRGLRCQQVARHCPNSTASHFHHSHMKPSLGPHCPSFREPR